MNILCRAFKRMEKSSSGVQLVLDTSKPGRSAFNCTSPSSDNPVKLFKFNFSSKLCFSTSETDLNCGPGRSYKVVALRR